VASDGTTITVGEYNWPSKSNGNKMLSFGERTLTKGDSGYPDGFLYIVTFESFLECDLLGDVCMSAGTSGGRGSNPTAQTDLVPHPKEYVSATGATFNVGDTIPSGVLLKFVGVTEVTGANASVGMSSGASDVKVRWEVKIGNGSWKQAGDDQIINNSSLTKGNRVERSWKYTIPTDTANGTSFAIRYTVDVKDVVFEKDEHNDRTETFVISSAPGSITNAKKATLLAIITNYLLDK
jgi:hypothetical protein